MDPSTITFTGNYSVWGIGGAQVFPQDFSLDLGNPGYNDPGGANTAASASFGEGRIPSRKARASRPW